MELMTHHFVVGGDKNKWTNTSSECIYFCAHVKAENTRKNVNVFFLIII